MKCVQLTFGAHILDIDSCGYSRCDKLDLGLICAWRYVTLRFSSWDPSILDKNTNTHIPHVKSIKSAELLHSYWTPSIILRNWLTEKFFMDFRISQHTWYNPIIRPLAMLLIPGGSRGAEAEANPLLHWAEAQYSLDSLPWGAEPRALLLWGTAMLP